MPRKKPVRIDPLAVDEGTKEFAAYAAMVVRNELEDFHVKYLSDAQMAELNPLIRNAICTAMHAYLIMDDSKDARAFAGWNKSMIPDYWEEPRLTDDFVEFVRYRQDRREGKQTEDAGVS